MALSAQAEARTGSTAGVAAPATSVDAKRARAASGVITAVPKSLIPGKTARPKNRIGWAEGRQSASWPGESALWRAGGGRRLASDICLIFDWRGFLNWDDRAIAAKTQVPTVPSDSCLGRLSRARVQAGRRTGPGGGVWGAAPVQARPGWRRAGPPRNPATKRASAVMTLSSPSRSSTARICLQTRSRQMWSPQSQRGRRRV